MRRAVARGAAAAAGLVALQAGVLAYTYETPLDAGGPHLGVCCPPSPSPPPRAHAAPLRVAWARDGLPGAAAARAFWRRPQRAQAPADNDAATAAAPGELPPLHAASTHGTRGGSHDHPAAAPGGLRCIVLGDSLVSGVGSSVSGSPALPQRFAAALAERLGARVTWRALGKTGADVAAMRASLLPTLRSEAQAGLPPPAVLLLLCGLNDFKQAHRGATSAAFHDELGELIAELRDICGPNTLVVLPALPLAATARFPVPLHWLVCALGARYDEQKRRLAQRLSFAPQGPARAGAVLFVDAPELPPAAEVTQLLSRDGVHPNDQGYAMWGAHIADAVALHLQRLPAAGPAPP